MLDEAPLRLLLVRHGNTFEAGETPTQVGARSDLPLTAQGLQQAHLIAQYLLPEKNAVKAIYAGSLKRQIDTATLISKELHIEERVHLREPALTEIDYGPWEGLTSDAIIAQWEKPYTAWTTESRWAEGIFGNSLQEHLQAIDKWLTHLRKTYASGDTVVGITSNGIMRFFYTYQREEWQRFQKEKQMEQIKVKTGHFCELLLFKDRLEIISWNRRP